MPVFGPIATNRKTRRFGVIDLEWVPGEHLPLPVNTTVEVEGVRDACRISLPVRKRATGPLQLRLAGYYDQVRAGDDDDEEAVLEKRYQCFGSVRGLLSKVLTRDKRRMWFFAHAGGLADME